MATDCNNSSHGMYICRIYTTDTGDSYLRYTDVSLLEKHFATTTQYNFVGTTKPIGDSALKGGQFQFLSLEHQVAP